MRIKVANYIADLLVKNGIKHVFTVTGGGAMHLNDAFGHHPNLQCIYNHHEQASAIAAESYARINNEIPLVCVTSGPGGTNAITGVAGAWVDSIPMLIISGQAKYTLTVQYSGLNLRTLGNQELDIISIVKSITKYSEMITDTSKVKYMVEKAIYIAKSGRPGPCWLDIPLDIQGSYVETDDLTGYDASEENKKVSEEDIDFIIEKVKLAKRPVINAGNGIRISGAYKKFRELIQKLNIPVVTGWNSIDLLPDSHPLYAGRAGIMGDRAGNFAVQNSDLLISLGSRLNIYQVGYNIKTWAREANTIVVDIDSEELKKPTIRVDKPICADVKDVINKLYNKLASDCLFTNQAWIEKCSEWKKRYPVVTEKHYTLQPETNIYAFMKELSKSLPESAVTIVANGSASVVSSQSYVIREGQRFIMNCALSSMGYDLPAAIGACIANNKKEVICIAGDGSIQMNLQELQTIITNKLPIKIFVINNGGYHQIRLTQKNLFDSNFVGVGRESGDLQFPSCEKLAALYGYSYFVCRNNSMLSRVISDVLNENEPTICEVIVTTEQVFEPKSATKRLEDGTLFSPPLEDLAPFLSREELKENMFIKMIDEC